MNSSTFVFQDKRLTPLCQIVCFHWKTSGQCRDMEIPAKWQVSEDKDIPYSRHQDWEQHQVGGGNGDGYDDGDSKRFSFKNFLSLTVLL